MKELISKDRVKFEVNSAEQALLKCFDMLIDFKHAKGNFNSILLSFQPLLADILYNLMAFYQELQSEKKQLVSEKSQYDKEFFLKSIRDNAAYSKIIKATIELGKSLGDAYAWFFFKDNRTELDKHFDHESTGLFVGGVGGRGELTLIKDISCIDGLYVIYHSITSMLRIGDFSLYDPKVGIVGVGEIKTKELSDGLQIDVNITSKSNINPSVLGSIADSSFEEKMKLMQQDFPKLSKQLSAHSELLGTNAPNHSTDLYTSYEYELVDNLSQGNPVVINEDRSLMLYVSWSKFNSLFDILFEQEEIDKLPDSFEENAKKLVVPSSLYNEVSISRLTTQSSRLSIPVLWWHINESICKEIYFKRIDIATMFNPAKLLEMFVKDGFVVSAPDKLKNIKIYKIRENEKIEIEHFDSLCYLTSHNLMKTKDVFALSKEVITSIENGNFNIGSKINMQIHLSNFDKTVK